MMMIMMMMIIIIIIIIIIMTDTRRKLANYHSVCSKCTELAATKYSRTATVATRHVTIQNCMSICL